MNAGPTAPRHQGVCGCTAGEHRARPSLLRPRHKLLPLSTPVTSRHSYRERTVIGPHPDRRDVAIRSYGVGQEGFTDRVVTGTGRLRKWIRLAGTRPAAAPEYCSTLATIYCAL